MAVGRDVSGGGGRGVLAAFGEEPDQDLQRPDWKWARACGSEIR